jgi:TPR repeat protein
MFFKKFRLTQHERRCANEFVGNSPRPPWDHLYNVLPFDLMEMAERGEPKAAFVMGDRLDQGMSGLQVDFQKALVYYRLGEEQGDPDALNNIGSMHFHGDGLPKDLEIARRYFELAAQGDCASAMNNLGRMYLEGEGGLRADIKQGIALLERGGRLYDVNAALKMQTIYNHGQYGQPADIFRRIYWLWHAAYNGSGRAYALIADYLKDGKNIRRQRDRVRYLYEQGMELGDSYATHMLGIDYWSGKCGEENLDYALHFMTRAEQMGDESATESIATLRKYHPELSSER